MHQDDIFKTLQVFPVLQDRKVRADGSTGRQHPQGVAVRYFLKHEEACRFADYLDLIVGFECRQPRAEFAIGNGDKIELEIRVIRRVDIGVGALHAFAVDFQSQLGELPGRKRLDGRMDGQTK